MSERVEGMAEEQKQAPAPSGAPRREGGSGGHGGHGPGGGHGGPRREGGPGGGGPGGPGGRPRGKRQYFRKKKVCKFCVEKMDFIDYKRADILSQFVQERGKILPRRMTGVCARHQRWLGVAIKRARNIALLPFAGSAAGTQAPRVVVPGAPVAVHAAPVAPAAVAPAAPVVAAPAAPVAEAPKA
ncbi:MAG TPA: 30S ribosomal protein S18 [Candidatus Acidoferrum sp.]|nr:30S ribosomal protein S18 [Candidatus Acidoferrum sp.]